MHKLHRQTFKLVGTTGGVAPWSVSESVTISANGQVEFVKMNEYSLKIILDTIFSINSSNVLKIWQAVQNNNFFSLDSTFQADSVNNGSFALLTIGADGTTKQVMVTNAVQNEIQQIIAVINENIPVEYNLNSLPAEKINIVPQDPCNSNIGLSFSIDKKKFLKKYLEKLQVRSKLNYPLNLTVVEFPHAGFEIGYEESLYDAVANGTATLRSKGDFYGDDVSITGKNPPKFLPPDIRIHIKLNLEFYGPCDNNVNENKVVSDILLKWNGLHTSDGREIVVDVPYLSHPGVSSLPGTPGYDEIKLDCDLDGRDDAGLGKPNNGVTAGTWYPSNAAEGTFGHEAGHLMGLDDQYDDYKNLNNGSWQDINPKSADYGKILSENDFEDLYSSRWGIPKTEPDFGKAKLASIPHEINVNDLMGNYSKPPLQSDIDKLAKQAGLIINIKPGDVLVDTRVVQQNLIVNHSNDLILKPGETKTLNGIYAACVDHFKEIPDTGRFFAVAPSLDKWNGINAAPALLKFVRYIDSIGYYCNYLDGYSSQEAIWRITDNTQPLDSTADSLLMNLGISIHQVFDFPRMNYNLNDSTTSSQYIPDQLFAADIEPKYTAAKINDKVSFTAGISTPSVGNFITNFIWKLNSPNSNSSQFEVNGSTATVTPSQGGVYSLSLDVTVNDSTGTKREFQPTTTSYAIVPDKFTETFEHNNLTDLFPGKLMVMHYGQLLIRKLKQAAIQFSPEILLLIKCQLLK